MNFFPELLSQGFLWKKNEKELMLDPDSFKGNLTIMVNEYSWFLNTSSKTTRWLGAQRKVHDLPQYNQQ